MRRDVCETIQRLSPPLDCRSRLPDQTGWWPRLAGTCEPRFLLCDFVLRGKILFWGPGVLMHCAIWCLYGNNKVQQCGVQSAKQALEFGMSCRRLRLCFCSFSQRLCSSISYCCLLHRLFERLCETIISGFGKSNPNWEK